MKISLYTGGFVQTNGYLVETPEGNFLVDAPAGVAEWLERRGVRVDDLLLTHQHYDHVEDAAAVRATGAKVHAWAALSKELTLETVARSWGMPITVEPFEVDEVLEGVGTLRVAGREIAVAHVPGHARDAVTFYLAEEGVLFSGDTLFAGSIGRTDLPGGNHGELLAGIARHLLALPVETRVLPGHGPATTIGVESAGNPYL